MIKILIESDGNKIVDSITKKNIDLGEVSLVLFKLKQIEQELIDMDFEEDFEVSENE